MQERAIVGSRCGRRNFAAGTGDRHRAGAAPPTVNSTARSSAGTRRASRDVSPRDGTDNSRRDGRTRHSSDAPAYRRYLRNKQHRTDLASQLTRFYPCRRRRKGRVRRRCSDKIQQSPSGTGVSRGRRRPRTCCGLCRGRKQGRALHCRRPNPRWRGHPGYGREHRSYAGLEFSGSRRATAATNIQLQPSLEAEARQVARLAASKGLPQRRCAVVRDPHLLDAYEAFEQEWQNLGGRVVARFESTPTLPKPQNPWAALQAQPPMRCLSPPTAPRSKLSAPHFR
jgi:hypothetical protein